MVAAAFRSAQHTPIMHGLIEVDVTRARAFLREQKANTGESLSFTAFLIACLAKAVEEHKAVQAFRQGSKHLILFEDVDVYTLIERDVAGQDNSFPPSSEPPIARPCARFITRSGQPRWRTWKKPVEWLQFLPALLFATVLLGLLLDGRRSPQRGRSTWGRWASRQWACLGKVPVGESLQPSQHS